MKIAMASDVVSPFCWMACHQVEQAIAQFPEVDFELELLPFQVSPGLPQDYSFAQYQHDYMVRTFGSMAAVEDMLQQVTTMGLQHGCEFHLEKITVWPNSKLAHGLWALGESAEQRWDLHKSICQAHFQLGLNLNDLAVLQQIGERQQLQPGLVQQRLQDDAYINDILTRTEATRKLDISSVPTIIVDDQYRVNGVAGRDQLAATIRAALAG